MCQAAREDLFKLKLENAQPKKENEKLKESDQALFSRGVEEHFDEKRSFFHFRTQVFPF
jgi:hypothetical protein